MTTLTTILAGNILHISRTFTRPAGSTVSVNPSTVKMAVTSPAGVTTALTPSAVVYDGVTGFTVTADWTIPDDAARGRYTITTDTSGGLTAAHQEVVQVTARTLAVVP